MARRSERCARSSWSCAELGLFTRAVVAIDGSKFKAVNNRDKNFTVTKVAKRMEQVDASIARYLAALDQADRAESDVAEAKTSRIQDKIAGLRRPPAPRSNRDPLSVHAPLRQAPKLFGDLWAAALHLQSASPDVTLPASDA